jgi:WD40 repeat protein
MMDVGRCAVIGRWFDPAQQLFADSPNPARLSGALAVALSVLALLSSAARSEPSVVPDAAIEAPSDPFKTDVAKQSLPPRALLRIGTDNLRTQSFITAIAFSPDGRLVAAAEILAPSPRVAIFDVPSGRQVKRLVAPGNQAGGVGSVAFSPDGTRLLWGGGEFALWDLSDDRLLFREKLHGAWVNEVAFSPDGSLIAVAEGDVVHLRRVAKPAEIVQDLVTLPGRALGQPDPTNAAAPTFDGRQRIGGMAFTPNGARLVAGTSRDATIFVWRIGDGQLLRKIPGSHGQSEGSTNPSLNYVAVKPDGRRIMAIGQTTKLLQDAKRQNGAKSVTMSEIRFWDIETGERIADYCVDEDFGVGLGALSRDGRRVAVSDFGRLRILDAATRPAERAFELPVSSGQRPIFSPDGTLVAMPVDNTIALFDVSTGRRLHHDESTPVGGADAAAWSPSGDRLVIGHRDGFVRLWDAATVKLIWHKLLPPIISGGGSRAHPAFVSFSRDGKLVVTAGSRADPVKHDNGVIAFYEADSGRIVREISQKEIRWGALAPDGRMVVVATTHSAGSVDAHFVGVEVETGLTRWANPPDQEAGLGPLAGMQFEAQSPWLDAALRDGNVIRFNALTGHEQRRFLADWRTPEQQKAGWSPGHYMRKATFSADGRTMVSSQMEWVYVWDVESGTMRRKFKHPRRNGCNLTLAPDGRTLATSDPPWAADLGDDTIRLYDIESGEQRLTLEPNDARASVMVFSPDGKRLFTGFGRGSGIVWDIRRMVGKSNAKE